MKKIAIIGAGISGLFIANLFKKNPNYQITIYEKNNSISQEEGYGIQLSVNSVKFLNEIGFDKIENKEKFTPEKIDFYSNYNSKKICELNISDFNLIKNTKKNIEKYFILKVYKKDQRYLLVKNTKFNFLKNLRIFPMEELSKPKKFNENLNFKMSNMNMNIKIQYLKNNKKIPFSYWIDQKELKNYMLPTFTKKIVKYLEKN